MEDMIMNPLVRDIIQTADSFVQSLPESHRKDFDYSVHSLAEVDDFPEWISDSIPFYIAGYAEHIAIGKEKKGYYATIV